MNRRDGQFDELLSAYLDGELTVQERQDVERELATNPQARQTLDAFRELDRRLKQLARYRLDSRAATQLLESLKTVSEEPGGEAATVEAARSEQREAFLDGELTDQQRERYLRQLEADPVERQRLNELEELQRRIAGLTRYQLEPGFCERVWQQIDAEHVSEVASRTAKKKPPPRIPTWQILGPLLAVAAIVLVMFYITSWDPRAPGTPVALPDPPVRDVLPAPEPIPDTPQEPERLPVAPDPQQMLVSAIGRQHPDHLVLVYEVSLTEAGVEQAAFANLLARHRIGMRQTVPVGPEEQAELLEQRFLAGFQEFDPQREDLDPVELYLVRSTGRQADAIYHDLLARPPGFGSFFLNLTTRDADDGLLHRLCEASDVGSEVGQAVRLVANLGILSRTARNLGAFGSIRWIDPRLLEPPSEPSESSEPAPVGEPAAPAAEDDFACEVLFVVRHLRGIR